MLCTYLVALPALVVWSKTISVVNRKLMMEIKNLLVIINVPKRQIPVGLQISVLSSLSNYKGA